MIVNTEGKIPEEALLRLSIQHIFRCVNPVFWSWSVREHWQNWPKLTRDIAHGWIQFMCFFFFCCNLLLQASESSLCDLRCDAKELVTTDTCAIKWIVRPNAALKASVGTTCAAVLLVAALLLSTYLLNDWPAHVLEKYAFQWYIWRPAQLSPPFVVRSVSYLCGKIFIMFLKIERKGAWGRNSSKLQQGSVQDWQKQ